MGTWFLLGLMDMVHNKRVVMAAQLYKYTKNTELYTFKRANFLLYELYVSKFLFNK